MIVRAVESALAQTHQDREIIVVDDGSADDTVECLRQYRNRIRYVYQENQGASAAQNAGIDIARGEWIAILASDDVWLPTKLETQLRVTAALGDEFGACFTDCRFIGDPDRQETAFQMAGLRCQGEYGPLDDPIAAVLAKAPALFVQSMLVRRALLARSHRFKEDLRVGEDTDLIFRLSFRTRFCVVAEPLVHIDRTPSRPRLTDLFRVKHASCPYVERKLTGWLQLPELVDGRVRQLVQNQLRETYYSWALSELYRLDFAEAFKLVRRIRSNGESYEQIARHLLFRAGRKCHALSLRATRSFFGNGSSSSGQILKSTAIIGSSNLFVAVTRLVQMKVFAHLLGPSGLGLVGIYHSIMATTATVGGLGLSSSGVRAVSESCGAGNERDLATVVLVLRRLTLFFGLLTATGLFLLRGPIADWVFDAVGHAGDVGVLSLGVLFTIVSGSQGALLNGLRRVKDLARANVYSAIPGTATAIALVWFWGAAAVPFAIVATTLVALISYWWFAQRVPRMPVSPGYDEIWTKCQALVRLGAAFMAGGLVMAGAMFLTRVILLDQLGLASVGYFQAAWAIVVLSIDFILNAMGVDFYPLLTARIRDRAAANQLVNEQTEVALLLGGPLILGMILFAPALIAVLYTPAFDTATDLLRWLLFGNILKIVSWPMSFLIMAQARAKTFVLLELLWASTYLSGIYLGSNVFGINAAGYAFLGSYVIYGTALYLIVRQQCQFAWTPKNLQLAITILAAGAFILTLAKQAGFVGYLVNIPVLAILGLYCLRRLSLAVRRT